MGDDCNVGAGLEAPPLTVSVTVTVSALALAVTVTVTKPPVTELDCEPADVVCAGVDVAGATEPAKVGVGPPLMKVCTEAVGLTRN